jgi:hypothetical protein
MVGKFSGDGTPEDVSGMSIKDGRGARVSEWFGEVKSWAGGETNRPDGMGNTIYSELEIMFTCYNVSKGKSRDRDVDESTGGPILLEASIEVIIINIPLEIQLKMVRRGKGEMGWVRNSGVIHTVAGRFLPTIV